MKLRVTALAAGIAVAGIGTLPAQAQQTASRQESVGVATGFTVGAVAGGPIGAIVGAAAGGWLGDRYHRQAKRSENLSTNLGRSEAERVRLTRDVTQLSDSLAQSQSNRELWNRALDRTRDLQTVVSFRTADAELGPAALEQVQRLGALASVMPGAKVRVAGYADPRGSRELNAALSQRRAEAVALALGEAGVTTEQLIVEAHGEDVSSSTEGDLDGYALERRVVVRIEHGGGEALAKAQ